MNKFLSQAVAAGAGLWIAAQLNLGIAVQAYPDSNFFGFALTKQWQIFLELGIILGLLNYFVKPLLKTLALPLEIITLGLFSIVINGALLWFLDLIFDELYIPWFLPLLYAALIIWIINAILQLFFSKKRK